MAVTVAPFARARPLDEVKDTGELRVVVYEDNAPFSWTDEAGAVRGVDADIARAVAEKMGLRVNLIARIAGEKADDDIRSNIWQGPRTGGLVGDVMMHVPMEREFIARNPLAAISNAYYHERIVLAVRADGPAVPSDPKRMLAPFRSAKLAVQFATVAHYFAMFADDGAYKLTVNPYLKFKSAADSFANRETAGLLGRRSQIEAELKGRMDGVTIYEPAFETVLRMAWTVGTAVKNDSRDTGYAFGNSLKALIDDGSVEKIFASYGLTMVAPPVP
ncbi:MAG: substrate-binding periplasmic protein [Hyphomicrobiaceae bacterium]